MTLLLEVNNITVFAFHLFQKAIKNKINKRIINGCKPRNKILFLNGEIMEINALELFNKVYPVGSIYMSVNSTNPSSLFGGTWVAWGSGRVPVGINTSDTSFSSVEKTGGSKTHSITANEMPSHTHSIPKLTGTAASAGAHTHRLQRKSLQTDFDAMGDFTNRLKNKEPLQQDGSYTWDTISPITTSAGAHTHTVSTTASTTGSKGSGTAMSLLQPYITCYMWKRTA